MTSGTAWSLRCVAAFAAAAVFVGCGSDSTDDNGGGGSAPVLAGTWTLSQATVNGTTWPTAGFGTATLALNADGTMRVDAALVGGTNQTYTGTYTTSGSTISFTVPNVPASAGVTMPVSATYSFDEDSLEMQLVTPITVSGVTVAGVFMTR